MTTFELKLGENKCSNEDYHADTKFYSSSVLKLLLKDRAAFYDQYILGNRRPQLSKDAFVLGSYVHSLILEPNLTDSEFAIAPGDIKIRRGKNYDAFKSLPDNINKTIITTAQRDQAEQMIDAYDNQTVAVELITGGEPEKTLCVELDGVPIKVRGDYVNVDKGYIVDIKTTAAGTDKYSVINTNLQWDYLLSASLYSMTFEHHYGKPFTFYWCYLGKRTSTCDVYKMSNKTRKQGDEKVLKALSIYKKCIQSGNWLNTFSSKSKEYIIEEI